MGRQQRSGNHSNRQHGQWQPHRSGTLNTQPKLGARLTPPPRSPSSQCFNQPLNLARRVSHSWTLRQEGSVFNRHRWLSCAEVAWVSSVHGLSTCSVADTAHLSDNTNTQPFYHTADLWHSLGFSGRHLPHYMPCLSLLMDDWGLVLKEPEHPVNITEKRTFWFW